MATATMFTRHSTAVRTATGTHSEPSPSTAAAMVGEKPPMANPICVPIAMPDRRTRAVNISP
ncbi:hypothetical protein H4W32_003645 [Actinophytocola algeriensis]|uniref:Uncharacterized protein n=1 Tax=Actinophytocola algeriensis TaxID=1768010 RepID=A0A7W7VGR2_9PSEU|nr:hypothetical protein [Actinophytocola algeriensis]MBE1475603.1 hypothetical protein [Actinophytocola algeriensis]